MPPWASDPNRCRTGTASSTFGLMNGSDKSHCRENQYDLFHNYNNFWFAEANIHDRKTEKNDVVANGMKTGANDRPGIFANARIFLSLQTDEPLNRMHTNNRLPLVIDLAFCLVLLPFMIWLLPVNRWAASNAPFVVLFVGWLYVVYFAYRYYTVPRMFRGSRQIVAAIAVIAVTLVVTWLISRYRFEIPQQAMPRMRPRAYAPEMTPRAGLMILHQRAVWFLYVVVAAFSFAVGTLAELYRQIVERQAAEHERRKAELALYKVQINPHFLFNTLNTLYGLMLTDVARAETAFMQFMELTKYMYTNAEKDKVSLRAEIDYIRQYIELQKNRMNDRTEVHLSIESRNERPDAVIAPMILITFVENALKYGVSSHVRSDIFIDLALDGDSLHFATRNPIVVRASAEKSGFGIANCRKRLDLLYPGRYALEIREEADEYRVTLDLKLH